MSKFKAPSPPMVAARWHGGAQTPGLIVMHSTVSSTKAGSAKAVAHYFATEGTKTSAHYCVDESTVVQCVGDHTVAYHCGYNADSIGVEMCDYPVANSLQHWLIPAAKRTGKKTVVGHKKINPLRWLVPDHRAMLKRTAHLVGDLCLAYDIPARTLTDAQLKAWDRAGRPARLGGIVTHAQMTRVFKKSTHWDPGKWPSQLFLHRVKVRIANRKKAAK